MGMPEPSANVVTLLANAAARVPQRIALASRGSVITFAELWRRVNATAAGLERADVHSGDRVLCFVPMSVDLYVSLLALLKLGAVAVFVDPWIAMRQMAAFAAAAEPRGFIGVPRSHWLRLWEPFLRTVPVTVTTGKRIASWPARWTLSELAATDSESGIHPVAVDSPALITFTSGSSGVPKGANRTHGFLAAQHSALQAEFAYRDDDVDLTMFPVFTMNNLVCGITSVIPAMDFRHVAAVDAGVVAAQMRQWRVTTCTVSPPLVDRLASQRPRLRRLLTGGAPITDEQLKHWQEAWPDTDIEVVYGSTEAEPVAHLSAAERLSACNGFRATAPGYCMGRPVTPSRVIPLARGPVLWNAAELPAGTIGELVVTGAHVCRDYFRNPQAVAENKILAPDGAVWHRMGDTGYFDEQGRFWMTGRLHSTICRAGEPVQAQLVEQAAGVRDAAAVGVTDRQLGERVVLVVTGAADQRAIHQSVKNAGLVVDEMVVTKRALPMDPRHNAKADYGKLRQWLEHKQKHLTLADSWRRRFKAYLDERFPLWNHGLLIVSYFSSNQFLAQSLTQTGQPMHYSGRSVLGAIMMLCLFFHLRVFDEHKDYADDCQYFPQRVLQRGLISLRDLKILGGIAIVLEWLLGAWLGWATLVSILAAQAFSVLMLKEFFCRDWLRRHFLTYATSHMLIMPLFALVVFSVATGRYLWEAPGWFWLYSFVGFFVTFNWEVSRKIRAPEQEIDGVETYTKMFGTYGAAYLVLAIRVVDTAMVALVGWHLGLSAWFYGVLVALYGVCLVGFFQYRWHTSPHTANRMEIYAGMYIVAFDLTLAVEIARLNGIRW